MDSGPEPAWEWPNSAKAAVSITYDGGDRSHLEFAAPLLEQVSIPATFFVPGGVFVEEVATWRAMKALGHEIGNGALCDWFGWMAMEPGQVEEWVVSELKFTEQALAEGLGAKPASAAIPWVERDNACVDQVTEFMRGSQVFVRSGIEGYNNPFTCDLRRALCIPCDGFDDAELVALCQSGMLRGAWTIFSFCGIGCGEPSVDRHAHDALIGHLCDHKSEYWVATFERVATHIALKR